MSDATTHSESDSHTEGPDRAIEPRTTSFSLRGLIAVITLLGIVLAIAVPQIEKAREAARRAQCQNNLKQLALAMHNHESAFKRLPIGIQIVPGRNDSADTKAGNWSWTMFGYPYVEQQSSYDVLNPKNTNCLSDPLTSTNYGSRLTTPDDFQPSGGKGVVGKFDSDDSFEFVLMHLNTVSPRFVCPSDFITSNQVSTRTGIEDSSGKAVRWPRDNQAFDLGLISYVAANSSRQCYALTSRYGNAETIFEEPDGIFHAVRSIKLRDIVDGQSNTVLLSERTGGSLSPGWDRQQFGKTVSAGGATLFGSRGIGNSSIDGSSTNDPADAWGAPDVLFSAWGGINLDDPVNPWRKFQGVSSHHPGGVNIARADGSVEFFANVNVPNSLSEYVPFSSLKPDNSQEVGPAKYDLWMKRWEPENVWRKMISRDDMPALLIE